jgi:Sulfotransferase family
MATFAGLALPLDGPAPDSAHDGWDVDGKLPNFLVLGTAKAGTSSLYVYLRQHPQVFLSPTTELNFFAHEGRDLNFSGPGDVEYIRSDSLVATYDEYCKQFLHVSGETAVGEISTHNLYSAQAPAVIKRYLPDVKMIAMLRHPVDRAFSAFSHMVRDGREETKDFRMALAREPERIRSNWEPLWHYKSMGFYGNQLSRYFDTFDRNQIRVYVYDDFVARPLEVVQDIFGFIGVDRSFVPDMSERHNVSTILHSRQLNEMMMGKSVVRSVLRKLVPPRARSRVRSSILKHNTRRIRLAQDVRDELANVYRADIGLLERLIDRDLSHWLKLSAS